MGTNTPAEVKLFLWSVGLVIIVLLAKGVLIALERRKPRRVQRGGMRRSARHKPAQRLLEAPKDADYREIALGLLNQLEATEAELAAVKGAQQINRGAGAKHIKLSRIVGADNIAVIGPKGSGKTTLLLTILHQRRADDNVSLDPHDSPSKWPCSTIGAGRNYGAIKTALTKLDVMMSARFADLGTGKMREGQFKRRTVVSDEYRSIATNIKEAGDYLLSRISEGRKVGECVLLASHNDTVEALGIKGNSDMKTCFDYIVYTGGLALNRYRGKGGASEEMIAELQSNERQYTVWDTERDEWYILDFDLAPVKVAQALPIDSERPAAADESNVLLSLFANEQTTDSTGCEYGTVRYDGQENRQKTADHTVPYRQPMSGIAHISAVLPVERPYSTGMEDTGRLSTDNTGGGSIEERVKALHSEGWSPSKIAMSSGLVKGEKGKRLEQVKAILGLEG